MIVLDSSCWLELIAGTEKGRTFLELARDTASLVVPTITLYEVFKKVSGSEGQQAAMKAAAFMKRGRRVDLDDSLALDAAQLSLLHRLPMADAILYASARAHDATLYTFDAHFKGLAGVEYR